MSPCDILRRSRKRLMLVPNVFEVWDIFILTCYQLLRFSSIWRYNPIYDFREQNCCVRMGGRGKHNFIIFEFFGAPVFNWHEIRRRFFEIQKPPVRNPPAFLPRPLLRAGNQPRQGESIPPDKLFRPASSALVLLKKSSSKC